MYNDSKGILLEKPKIIQLPKLHLTTIRDTIVSCTMCRASRMISIKTSDGRYTQKKCFGCNGSGLTYISKSGSSVR